MAVVLTLGLVAWVTTEGYGGWDLALLLVRQLGLGLVLGLALGLAAGWIFPSALAQGPTLEPLARRLGLATEGRPLHVEPLEVGAIRSLGADVLEFPIDERSRMAGKRLRELGLPPEAVVIVRDLAAVPPRGSTRDPARRPRLRARARRRAAGRRGGLHGRVAE